GRDPGKGVGEEAWPRPDYTAPQGIPGSQRRDGAGSARQQLGGPVALDAPRLERDAPVDRPAGHLARERGVSLAADREEHQGAAPDPGPPIAVAAGERAVVAQGPGDLDRAPVLPADPHLPGTARGRVPRGGLLSE